MTALLRTAAILLLVSFFGATDGLHRHRHYQRHHHHPTNHRNPIAFIMSSCRTTLYPALCFSTLSTYAPALDHSPRQLAHVALTVSVNHAHAASAFILHLSSGSHKRGAVSDCLEMLGDSVDQLRTSVAELRKMGPKGSERFEWHLSNAQTWVSAALTDQNTCLDSLAEDSHAARVRAAISLRIVVVAKVTSIALALVNRVGDRR